MHIIRAFFVHALHFQLLFKTGTDNFYNCVLLRYGHFVVARETQAAAEQIASCIAACGYVIAVFKERLQMHRLPQRSALGVQRFYRLQYFHRAGFAVFFLVCVCAGASGLLTHCFGIHRHARQPKIGFAVPCIWIHADRQVLKALFVSVVYCLFSRRYARPNKAFDL